MSSVEVNVMKQIGTDDDIRFRHDDLKPQKSIVVESNYDYTPKRKDELKLKRGATIKVIRRDGLERFPNLFFDIFIKFYLKYR